MQINSMPLCNRNQFWRLLGQDLITVALKRSCVEQVCLLHQQLGGVACGIGPQRHKSRLVGLSTSALNHPADLEEKPLPWNARLNRPCDATPSRIAIDALAFSELSHGSAQMLTI